MLKLLKVSISVRRRRQEEIDSIKIRIPMKNQLKDHIQVLTSSARPRDTRTS